MYTYRVPVSEDEHLQLLTLCKDKHLKRSSMMRMLLTEAVREYRQECNGRLSISLKYADFERFNYEQIYVPAEIHDFFCELSKAAGGLTETQLVRQFLIPKLMDKGR